MDAEQSLGSHPAHPVRDRGAHVAALRHKAVVAESPHQLGPDLRDAAGPPAELGRLGREAVPRDRRDDDVERVVGAPAVGGRVGEGSDDLEHLDHRAGPTMRDDHRQGVLVLRADVDEVDVHAVDLGHELRQRVELRLTAPPVVPVQPVAGERLSGRQLHALRAVGDQLLARPPRCGNSTAQVVDRLLRKLDVEGPDLGRGLDARAHSDLPSRSDVNAARISSAKISGSSHAAKCPPLGASLK